jgi:hypothetical protein
MLHWPAWYEWELEFNVHLEERMKDRGFDEVDLRIMIEMATGFREDHVPGRWIIDTTHEGRSWEVIVEPLEDEQKLMVVTAYAPD